jgi:hypothetical protein
MDWLSKHKTLIDCAKKSVKLTIPKGKEMEFVAEPIVTTKGVANCAKVNQLDASLGSEMPVVNEFPNVFLEGLPGCRVGWCGPRAGIKIERRIPFYFQTFYKSQIYSNSNQTQTPNDFYSQNKI